MLTPVPLTARRVTWGQAFWAVVAATILGAFATLFLVLGLMLVGVPIEWSEEASGRGWPWRIEGPWSLAADIGPLLIVGAVFAWLVEGYTRRHTQVRTRRLPIALTAAVLGWVNLGGVDNAGVLGAGGAATFVALVIVVREMSGRTRPPWRWTRRSAWATLVLASALALTSLSYGLLHPLAAADAELADVQDGLARISFPLRNGGQADVRLLSATVPGVRSRAMVSREGSYEYEPGDPYGGYFPLAGEVISGNRTAYVTLFVRARCPSGRVVDRAHVRLRVLGRTMDQVVRLSPVPVGCS